MQERCFICEEFVTKKIIKEEEVQITNQTCFICRKPVCGFHSSPDSTNVNMVICDDCSYNED